MVDIIENKKVLKSNYLYADLVQITFSTIVIFLSGFVSMDLAIKLDRQVFLNTIEIENIASNTMLPAKLASVEL